MRRANYQRALSIPSIALPLLLASVLSTGSRGQHKVTFEITGTNSGDGCGYSLAFADDVDGDGIGDHFVGYRAIRRVRAVSGASGQVLWTAIGPDTFGHAMAVIGDISGDGVTDVAVGAPGADDAGVDSGQVSVLSGADGTVLQAGIFPFRAPMIWNGDAAGDEFGYSVAGSDLTLDGCKDIVVGAPRADTLLIDPGMVTAFDAKAGTRLFRHYGDVLGERLGQAVTELGDVTSGPEPEIAAGAPRFQNARGSDVGRVQVLQWSSGPGVAIFATFEGISAGERFGSSVVGVGDVNIGIPRDGVPDLLIGAPNAKVSAGSINDGRVRLQSGGFPFPYLQVQENTPGGGFGTRLLAAGDLNGDSVPDYAVAATNADSHGEGSGSVFVYSGAAPAELIAVISGDEPHDNFGWAMTAGDRDGVRELFVGVPFHDTPQVGAGLVRGVDIFQLESAHSIVASTQQVTCQYGCPPDPNESASTRSAILGDVNLDGASEFAIAVPGRVTVYSGVDGTVLWSVSSTPEFGSSLAAVGDVDGDGFGDLLISATPPSLSLVNPGFVEVYSGATGALVHRVDAGTSYVGFGERIFRVGDIDGDGYADFGLTTHPASSPSPVTRVHMYSGRTGLYDWGLIVSAPDAPAVGIGDTDGDGLGEVAIANQPNTVTIYDGNTAVALSVAPPMSVSEVAAVGDVTGDGAGDYAVVRPTGLAVFSGATSNFLWSLQATPDARVFSAGDHNGDGVLDVAYGSPTSNVVRIHSGDDGRLLWLVKPPDTNARFAGVDLHAGSDITSDGRPDVLIGYLDRQLVSFVPPVTMRYARTVIAVPTPLSGVPPRVLLQGTGCPGSGGLPQLDVRPQPGLGESVDVWLRAAPGGAPVAMFLGPAGNLDLTALGAPGCTSFIDIATSLSVLVGASGQGTARIPLTVPTNTALVGRSVVAQWIVVDPPANTLGITVSTARELAIGEYRS